MVPDDDTIPPQQSSKSVTHFNASSLGLVFDGTSVGPKGEVYMISSMSTTLPLGMVTPRKLRVTPTA